MGNIIGKGFADSVTQQINLRQKVLGLANNIPDSILKWNNANTSWVKLASSVDTTAGNTGDSGYNSDLAKNNILFGGTVQFNDNKIRLKPSNGSYGLSPFGYKPMAAIMGVDISYLNNNGTLQKAIINVKAYSPEQLNILDKLYMRPGYNILLEWGHTLYLDNSNEQVQEFTSFATQPFIFLFDKTKSPQDILTAIKVETLKYYGNYGAFYGPIVKFNWKFNPDDASYDITIEAISQGHIIESLRLNTAFKQASNSTSQEANKNEDIPSIIAYKNYSAFNGFLYDIYINSNTQGQEIQKDLAQQAVAKAIAKTDVSTAVAAAIVTGEIGTAVEIVEEKIKDIFDQASSFVEDLLD